VSVTRCFTFGSGHAEKHGIPFPSFVRITAETAEKCRAEMFRLYGREWAFDYSEAQIEEQKKRHHLKEVPLVVRGTEVSISSDK
jgi:hypothetical protein